MIVSIAKGSFDEDGMASPQLTMDSVDSDETSPAQDAVQVDEDEHDVQVPEPPAREKQPRGLGAPLSSGSLPSVQSTDQVLEHTNRLDLSDSHAILSRLSCSPRPGLSNRRSPSRRSSKSPRRVSLHETHDSAPLRRGEFLYYLYSFAILGTTIRIFMGRLFGYDCEFPGEVQDFLTPLSKKICVTSSGFTNQHGGGLFLDLPANMLGSFVMGLVSSANPSGGRYGSKLPWLRRDHPLQRHDGIHHALKVGFCGSLTTFSSWNSQMVSMLDGTGTVLGPQVVPALFGYVIGMACASWAFVAGGRVHEWLYDWSNGIRNSNWDEKPQSAQSIQQHEEDEEQPPTSWDSEESTPRSRHSASSHDGEAEETISFPTVPSRRVSSSTVSIRESLPGNTSITVCLHKMIPFCISVSLLVAYGLGVGEHNAQFFRELCACSILTPIGVHLRWKLSALNGSGIGSNHRYEWLPWGTFAGNLSASVISVVFQALYVIYSRNGKGDHPYVLALMVGVKVGVAGSLSTVSSFAKETVNLATIHPTHAKAYSYSALTITASMLLGLAVYSPVIRYA